MSKGGAREVVMKIQMDTRGESILFYSKGHNDMTQFSEPGAVAAIRRTTGLSRLGKCYWLCRILGSGGIELIRKATQEEFEA